MSYEEFRRRIDTARNILVGAVPSPAGQIDQITYALIYKFMNDIDDKAASLPGGKRTYFSGDYEKYNWHALMSSQLGAHDRLELYRQAIQNMSKNDNLPPLFREIYQNAFLPFNSANVLNLFLKEMDKFDHGDSDDIGDAYEYLLSITGSQGDVGQFRTPRHIIKFIVEAINPTKDDSVLDPACGTAGFLIAAYNHIRAQHDGKDKDGKSNDEQQLNADEEFKLHKNYHGFDIDPTMVRTAGVNMYLHGFTTPDIINHDTLSSEDLWDRKYDVILANPPFMTPKGGIQPHKKFSINASRAEVLFVDYIASHINPITGRAGIVVPEGVIFQSGNAYKQLRKNLVENSLYAVISLPAGVFQPYAGVKTSILLLDKKIAKERDEILFVKIENDGYSLGAQRRIVSGDQFPEAHEIIEQFKAGKELNSTMGHAVSRKAIANSGDYNLSGDRYRLVSKRIAQYGLVSIGDIANVDNGNAFKSSEYVESGARVIRITNVQKGKIVDFDPRFMAIERLGEFSKYQLNKGDLLMSLTGNVGRVGIIEQDLLPALLNQRVARLRLKQAVDYRYVFFILNSDKFEKDAVDNSSGIAQKNLSTEWLKTYQIPLPPIEIQREIVAELDCYQKIIDAAQIIVKNYKPTIKIKPEWPLVNFGDKSIFNIQSGGTPDSKNSDYWDGDIQWATLVDLPATNLITEINETVRRITNDGLKKSSAKLLPIGTVLVSSRATIGRVAIARIPLATNQGFKNVIITDDTKADSDYIAFQATTLKDTMQSLASGGTFSEISKTSFETLRIPLPPIEIQHEIVAELEAEQKIIDANKKLIEIYQQKIKTKLAEIWGE